MDSESNIEQDQPWQIYSGVPDPMLRGNRLLVSALAIAAAIAILIGWSTWPTSPRLTSYGESNPRNSEYRPGGHQCEPTVLAAIRDSGKRIRQADSCAKEAEEYRLQTNDLIQQARAADAATAQTNIASQQLWTGWLQTLGGFFTLCAAVGAAIYARGAEKASIKALKAFHNSECGQLAFVTHDIIGPDLNIKFILAILEKHM